MTAYTVKRIVRSTVTVCRRGSIYQEPATTAHIYAGEQRITSVSLNGCTLCLPGDGGVYGLDATNEQIIRAVLGDEDIFTGAPAFPEHHDAVTS